MTGGTYVEKRMNINVLPTNPSATVLSGLSHRKHETAILPVIILGTYQGESWLGFRAPQQMPRLGNWRWIQHGVSSECFFCYACSWAPIAQEREIRADCWMRHSLMSCEQNSEPVGRSKMQESAGCASCLLNDHDPKNSSSSKCKFKLENGRSLHRYATDRSPELQALLDRYSQMHAACVSLERHNLEQIYQKKMKPQCRYIVWSCTFGLGNKLMSLVSTFLYAILSQRVLLLEESESWDRLFCDPFDGASLWRLPRGVSLREDQSAGFVDFLGRCAAKNSICSAHVLPIVFSADTKPDEHRFLVCPSAMASVKNIPILNFRNSNQYFAAGFFLNPALRPVLETIFRERRVFHNLAGFLLNPSDEVWESIKQVHSERFHGASRRIGVQLRESKGEYRDFYDVAVPRCIRTKSGLCPIEIDEYLQSKQEQQQQSANLLSDDFFSVYVSSLIGQHSAKLNASLRELETETGQIFELVTQKSDEEQLDDVEHQQKALVDMWALSLTDVLLTSHMSTFGYTAQGLAGITAYFLKPWPENPCWLGVSSDPCFHFAPPKNLACKQDGFTFTMGANGKRRRRDVATDVAQYVAVCPDLPDTGLQLIEQ